MKSIYCFSQWSSSGLKHAFGASVAAFALLALVAAIREHAELVEAGARMIAANKAIEGIGDHVKDIAESIVLPIEGKDIRHRGLKETSSE